MYYRAVRAGAGSDALDFLQLAGHPLRWRLLRELARSDRRVNELTGLLGEPQNLVSYHLGKLRSGRLVSARRSSADGRDRYYTVDLPRLAGQLSRSAPTAFKAGTYARNAHPLPGLAPTMPTLITFDMAISTSSEIPERPGPPAAAGLPAADGRRSSRVGCAHGGRGFTRSISASYAGRSRKAVASMTSPSLIVKNQA